MRTFQIHSAMFSICIIFAATQAAADDSQLRQIGLTEVYPKAEVVKNTVGASFLGGLPPGELVIDGTKLWDEWH